MFALSDVGGILQLLEKFLAFGRSEIGAVQSETEELIRDLSSSLVSLHDVVSDVTRLKTEKFNEESFAEVHDYFYRFYLNPEDIDKARTHCSTLKRDVGRITYKLANVLHTDIGKWNDVSSNIESYQYLDEAMLQEYDTSIKMLKAKLDLIQSKFAQRDIDAGLELYRQLKEDLSEDIEQLRAGVAKMKEVAVHIRETSG